MLPIRLQVRALPGSKVVVPTTAHRQDYLSIVTSLPDTDAPLLFSLPPNIDRSVQQANSDRVVMQLKQVGESVRG
jgi:dynein heavy chain 2